MFPPFLLQRSSRRFFSGNAIYTKHTWNIGEVGKTSGSAIRPPVCFSRQQTTLKFYIFIFKRGGLANRICLLVEVFLETKKRNLARLLAGKLPWPEIGAKSFFAGGKKCAVRKYTGVMGIRQDGKQAESNGNRYVEICERLRICSL